MRDCAVQTTNPSWQVETVLLHLNFIAHTAGMNGKDDSEHLSGTVNLVSDS